MGLNHSDYLNLSKVMGDYAIITPATWNAMRACPLFANLEDPMVFLSPFFADSFQIRRRGFRCQFETDRLPPAARGYCKYWKASIAAAWAADYQSWREKQLYVSCVYGHCKLPRGRPRGQETFKRT
jgi:hypothetical protein